ncbi:MAG: hypothetical protein IMZ50_09985 [Candidatus Atribacteria bacterium]|nr:hypothetical protein [Candidatus Atribacteria bacterium]
MPAPDPGYLKLLTLNTQAYIVELEVENNRLKAENDNLFGIWEAIETCRCKDCETVFRGAGRYCAECHTARLAEGTPHADA